MLVEHTKNYEKQTESSPLVEYTEKHDQQKVFSSLKEYDSSDIKRIVHEHLNSISVIDAQGNVLIVFMAVPVANFVGESVQEMNKNGLYSWSPSLKAIETGSPVLGTVKSKFGNEQLVACTPLMDENGKLVMAVDVALDKKLVDKYFEGIKDGGETCNLCKTTINYLSNDDAFPENPIAESPSMRRIISTCNVIAKTDSPVMLTGESGTGKEVIARYIHRNSLRAREPFIPVNCAAIPRELMEAEFFGYVKGAFTGASAQGKSGLFEIADKGTLFLDEIGELPLDMQSKLLRVLESGEIKNVGGTVIKKTNVRLITATNQDLKLLMSQNLFREDVYYRLSVMPITIPPLRERLEDIEPIAQRFLHYINIKHNTNKVFTKETLEAFYRYDWPGNVREMRNVIERLAITAVNDELNLWGDYQLGTSQRLSQMERYLPDVEGTSHEPLKDYMNRVEMEYINKVLEESDGRVSEAAKRLGIHRTMLYRKLKAMKEE